VRRQRPALEPLAGGGEWRGHDGQLSCAPVGGNVYAQALRISLDRAPGVVARATRGRDTTMIFDFIRKRSEEGIRQVQNLATKTAVSLSNTPACLSPSQWVLKTDGWGRRGS
jgi:hypothetical protein